MDIAISAALNAIPEVISIQDLDHNVERINNAGADFFSISAEDATGRKCYELVGRDAPCRSCPAVEVHRTQRAARAEKYLADRGLWMDTRAYPVFDDTGRMVRIIEHLRDVSHEKSAGGTMKTCETEWHCIQRQLLHARKMEAVGTLAGGVAHEFNNLMMAVQGHISLMMMDIDAAHPHHTHLKGIEKCIDSARDLTRQLIDIRREEGSVFQPTRLNGVLDQCAHIFGRNRKEIRILRKYEKHLWEVSADRKQLRQVILNLYVNAWQAMPIGGKLTISTRNVYPEETFCRSHDIAPGPFVKCTVADNGIGMDPATLARVFDPFFTTRGLGNRAGLGLASVYGIIRRHHGAITVSSEIGNGATFSIYLPALTPTAHGAAPFPH